MAVALEEVTAALDQTERRLRVIPKDHPERDALHQSLEDLRLLHQWLSNKATRVPTMGLEASRLTVERAQRLLAATQEPRRRRQRTSPALKKLARAQRSS